MEKVLNKVPEEAKGAIEKAIEASKERQEEAVKETEELEKEVSEIKQEIEETENELNVEENKKEETSKKDEQKKEIEKLKKEVETLKQKQPQIKIIEKIIEKEKPIIIEKKESSSSQVGSQTKQNENIVTLPNGAVVEMDENGKIVKTIKEALTNITQTPTTLLSNNSISNNEASSMNNPEYQFKILSFEPIYIDVDYEIPPNREINHYKMEMQFGDQNNAVDYIYGNFKIFLENKLFQGVSYTNLGKYPLSNFLIYDNFKETETKLSNPFVFKYTLVIPSLFPKNEDELNNYFLTATYKDQRHRIHLEN